MRITEAFKSPILPLLSDHLHLAESDRSLKTVCGKDVANLTMIPVGMFGKPSDVSWCPACIAWTDRDRTPKAVKKSFTNRAYKRSCGVRYGRKLSNRIEKLSQDGFTQREIAAKLGVSQGTVGKRLRRLLSTTTQ